MLFNRFKYIPNLPRTLSDLENRVAPEKCFYVKHDKTVTWFFVELAFYRHVIH